jgi:hypothetical protein
MSEPAPYRALLDAALADPATGVDRLSALPPDDLDAALKALARERGEAALPLVSALAERGAGPARRVARRALYRLAQSGITRPAREPRPVIERRPAQPLRAWISGIDGSGSRAAWILFEGAFGGLALCSVIINDTEGILEAAGGEITKKRLESELAVLRASQKLPWVELPAEQVIARVRDAYALHAARGTSPPAEFARWEKLFATAAPGAAPPPAPAGDAVLADRAGQLFDLPELMGWFLDPERVQGDAVKLMEARSSRLVVSDQIKAEREAAIVREVVEREITAEARRIWSGRLTEMALIFEQTGRAEAAAIARAAAGQLLDPSREATRVVFARRLAERALDVASEVVSGRLRASDVSRQVPRRGAPPPFRTSPPDGAGKAGARTGG